MTVPEFLFAMLLALCMWAVLLSAVWAVWTWA